MAIDAPRKKDRPTGNKFKMSKIQARLFLSNFLEEQQAKRARIYPSKHPDVVEIELAVKCADMLFAEMDS
jgi:hypothetical protein